VACVLGHPSMARHGPGDSTTGRRKTPGSVSTQRAQMIDHGADPMTTTYTTIDSPVGPLLLAANDEGLQLVEFHESRHVAKRGDDWVEGGHPLLDAAARQLDEYFNGQRNGFDLPLAPRGTQFQ